MKIGFMGRTKMLADTIDLVSSDTSHEVAFIWTSKDEDYYQYEWREFRNKANHAGCPFIYNPDIDKSEDVPDADVVLSMNFVNVIPGWFLNKFTHGIVNAHAGDLPRYKGNACPNWAIINNEDEVTLTIHRMEEALDSGPIYYQSHFKLRENTFISDIYYWLSKEVPKLFLKTLNNIHGGVNPVPQTGRSLRTYPRKPEDARLVFNNGLDWNYRLIRASSKPFNGAFCYLNGESTKVVIWNARPVDCDFDFYAVNGQIIDRDLSKQRFMIAIDNKALLVDEYSIDGQSKEEAFNTICGSLRNRLL